MKNIRENKYSFTLVNIDININLINTRKGKSTRNFLNKTNIILI